VIDAAAKAVSRPKGELVIPGSEPTGFERLGQRTDEVVFVLPCMRDEDVELNVLGTSVRGHERSVCQLRWASMKRDPSAPAQSGGSRSSSRAIRVA
jgi:hypothetical protein